MKKQTDGQTSHDTELVVSAKKANKNNIEFFYKNIVHLFVPWNKNFNCVCQRIIGLYKIVYTFCSKRTRPIIGRFLCIGCSQFCI